MCLSCNSAVLLLNSHHDTQFNYLTRRTLIHALTDFIRNNLGLAKKEKKVSESSAAKLDQLAFNLN